jgi:hypothetical protein
VNTTTTEKQVGKKRKTKEREELTVTEEGVKEREKRERRVRRVRER